VRAGGIDYVHVDQLPSDSDERDLPLVGRPAWCRGLAAQGGAGELWSGQSLRRAVLELELVHEAGLDHIDCLPYSATSGLVAEEG
jgi:hypothetical protein